MYKATILVAIVLSVLYATGDATRLRSTETQFGRNHDFDYEDDAPATRQAVAEPVANKLAQLQQQYRVSTKLPKQAVVEHEASHLEQESASADEHTSSGKNASNRVRSRSNNKVKNVSQKEKFHNNEEELKQTPTLFHSKKSNTNYVKSYNKSKKENMADYDQDQESHSKFVHKKNNSSNKLKKNHVKDANGKHIDESENFDNNDEEEYARSS